MEGRAAREMMELFDKYAKIMYGIPIPGEEGDEAEGEAEGNADEIEDLVQKEIASLKAPLKSKNSHFTCVRLNVECLLFSKTTPPIDPVAMAHRISVDIKKKAEEAALVTEEAIESGAAAPVTREFRYLNRLTPITASGRANERGVREVARKVLSPWFKLAPQPAAASGGGSGEPDEAASSGAAPDEAPGEGDISNDEKPAYTVSDCLLFTVSFFFWLLLYDYFQSLFHCMKLAGLTISSLPSGPPSVITTSSNVVK